MKDRSALAPADSLRREDMLSALHRLSREFPTLSLTQIGIVLTDCRDQPDVFCAARQVLTRMAHELLPAEAPFLGKRVRISRP